MGKKGGGDGGAAAARADEQARQERVRQGTQRINAIFDGGTYTTTPQTPISGGGSLGQVVANLLPATATTSVEPGVFTKDFYDQRRKSYVDYATPQLDQQFGEARKDLTFALARNGTLDSSIRAGKDAELTREYDKNRRDISDKALSFENQTRTSVEDARANLISMLNATGDAEGTANNAISRAKALSQPEAYSSLGPLFANFTSALGTQAAMERAEALSGGAVKAPYNTGLFANSRAVKVT